jgi:bacillithiol synthase
VNAECYPISTLPHISRLFLDYCERRTPIAPFYSATPYIQVGKADSPVLSERHRERLANLLLEQNFTAQAKKSIEGLRQGAAAIVSGQQVALFGGPLFTPFKAATAIGRAQKATDSNCPAVPVFWLASEDHDFAEINHVTIPSSKELRTFRYDTKPPAEVSVGQIVFDDSITALTEEAVNLLGYSDAADLISSAYKPGQSFSQAFAKLLACLFAAHGLIVFDPSGREAHALGAEVLRQAIERAEELSQALIARDVELHAAGYHSQVLVGGKTSLLFLTDTESRARLPLKRLDGGKWQAGRQNYTSADLLAILASEPERLSPSALLRPVFQDAILPTAAYIGGPAEIAYYAQSQVLFERILGRTTPILPRLSATLVEPAVADLLRKHEVSVDSLFGYSEEVLAQRLSARAMPIEGKQKLARAGNALNSELESLTKWMHSVDPGLGRSADTSASKMRYQMNRLRRMAANFQLQKEASLARHAAAISMNLYPQKHLQERLLAGVYFFARYGLDLAATLIEAADSECPGHKVVYL